VIGQTTAMIETATWALLAARSAGVAGMQFIHRLEHAL
jgi:hypothetical protein